MSTFIKMSNYSEYRSYPCWVLLLMALDDSSPPTASDSHVCNDSANVMTCTNTVVHTRVYVHVWGITSYLASSPLRRPKFWAVSVIWGSRLEGSPICGFCSYTPFIFSSASLRSGRGRKMLLFWRIQALITEVSLLCSTADKTRRDGQKLKKLADLLQKHTSVWH